MIKKNIKVIFENGDNKRTEEMIGGIPLSKGEILHIHEGNKVVQYEVVDKMVDIFLNNDDEIVNITYIIKKKSL